MQRKRNIKTSSRGSDASAVLVLPRPDVTDDDIVSAVLDSGGFPSLVADRFSMTIPDLLARAKASKSIAGAFAEAKQRMVDRAKAQAIKTMLGDATTPPDPLMLRWFIERYE